jgi:hypothetical protein
LASFDVQECGERIEVTFDTRDRHDWMHASVTCLDADAFEATPLFSTLEAASQFFHDRSVGFSESRRLDALHGLRMTTESWAFEPAAMHDVRSSYFEDRDRFPPGTATLDSAFIMRNVKVRFHALPNLPVRSRAARRAAAR